MTITLNGTTGITTPAVTNNGAYTGDGISFADATPSNTLVTDTSGNVGIGTSSPAVKLHVNGSGSIIRVATDTSSSGTIDLSATSTSAVINANTYATAVPLVFQTASTERMRIDSSGNLLVGTATANGSATITDGNGNGTALAVTVSTSAHYLQVFRVNSTGVGTISTNGTTTAYNTTSDYRLKEDVMPMQNALATVSALKPVTYKWKSDGSDGQGFIAHELQEVVPDAVSGEKDAVNEDGSIKPQGIDTSFLVATLTAAIQELKAELDTVKTELATLKGTA